MNELYIKTLETERLILRKFAIDDAENMYNNWASDDNVTRYMSWSSHSDISVTKSIIDEWVKSYKKPYSFNWCIELKEINQPIGSIGIINISIDENIGQVGYCISKSYWGKGITAEALRAVLKFAFMEVEFENLTAYHNVENPNSGKVMLKCGLKFEEIKKDGAKNNQGQPIDIKIYSISKDDYLKHLSL